MRCNRLCFCGKMEKRYSAPRARVVSRGFGRAPRRGWRPDGPFFVLRLRAAPASCMFASGATSFCPRRQKDAKTPPKTNGFWISFCLIATAVQKGSARDRLYFFSRCRSHVPQDSALSYRRRTAHLCMVRESGSDKRTASDSLYDEMRRSKSRVIHSCGFQRTPTAQEVLKPAVSSSVFGHFWGCGQK